MLIIWLLDQYDIDSKGYGCLFNRRGKRKRGKRGGNHRRIAKDDLLQESDDDFIDNDDDSTEESSSMDDSGSDVPARRKRKSHSKGIDKRSASRGKKIPLKPKLKPNHGRRKGAKSKPTPPKERGKLKPESSWNSRSPKQLPKQANRVRPVMGDEGQVIGSVRYRSETEEESEEEEESDRGGRRGGARRARQRVRYDETEEEEEKSSRGRVRRANTLMKDFI